MNKASWIAVKAGSIMLATVAMANEQILTVNAECYQCKPFYGYPSGVYYGTLCVDPYFEGDTWACTNGYDDQGHFACQLTPTWECFFS